MIKIIGHRANLNGPDPIYENTIGKSILCLSKGFDIELDIHQLENEDCFRLGHDFPRMNESVNMEFLENEKIWCHCKNIKSYETLLKNPLVNCFFHSEEDYVFTSKGFTWFHSRTLPPPYMLFGDEKKVYTYFVHKDKPDWADFIGDYYVCTDYPLNYVRDR